MMERNSLLWLVGLVVAGVLGLYGLVIFLRGKGLLSSMRKLAAAFAAGGAVFLLVLVWILLNQTEE